MNQKTTGCRRSQTERNFSWLMVQGRPEKAGTLLNALAQGESLPKETSSDREEATENRGDRDGRSCALPYSHAHSSRTDAMRLNALGSRLAQLSALALPIALALVLAGCDLDLSGLDWDGLGAPCRPGASCEVPSPPDAASAWEGDWTGTAEVTYYGTDGGRDSTRGRDIDLQIEINPYQVDQIQFERARRPSRLMDQPWDHLSKDSLHVASVSDTTEITFAFGTEDGGAKGRVAVRDTSAAGQLRRVWAIDMRRPEN